MRISDGQQRLKLSSGLAVGSARILIAARIAGRGRGYAHLHAVKHARGPHRRPASIIEEFGWLSTLAELNSRCYCIVQLYEDDRAQRSAMYRHNAYTNSNTDDTALLSPVQSTSSQPGCTSSPRALAPGGELTQWRAHATQACTYSTIVRQRRDRHQIGTRASEIRLSSRGTAVLRPFWFLSPPCTSVAARCCRGRRSR